MSDATFISSFIVLFSFLILFSIAYAVSLNELKLQAQRLYKRENKK